MGESAPIRTSVIIVGGGPVGLGLAAALGTAGIPAVLLERRKDSSTVPKGQNLTARTLEHFYFWGCADQLRAARLLPPGFPIGGITAYSSLADKHWYAPAGRETVSDFYFQRLERLPQYLTESVLRDRVAELDSVVEMFGWSATDLWQGNDGVRVTAVADSGARREIEGAFVVGCDGGHSLVRAQAGIGASGVDLGQRMVLAVFRSAELSAGLDRFPKRTTYRVLHPDLQGYWQFFGRVDSTQTWFFHAPVPADATPATLNAEALVARAAGFPVTCEFEYVGLWTMRTEVADTYQNGRAFIAGDAAHSHPPYGAYGLNTGLEDVVNLAWKLAAVLRGWAPRQLLDTYSAERRPIMFEQRRRSSMASRPTDHSSNAIARNATRVSSSKCGALARRGRPRRRRTSLTTTDHRWCADSTARPLESAVSTPSRREPGTICLQLCCHPGTTCSQSSDAATR